MNSTPTTNLSTNEGPLSTMEKGGGFLDNTFKMSGYRKRRLSKLPTPVIIPPPTPIIIAPSPVSPETASPQSPTKRFVLKPITALTAAFQRTAITGRKTSSTLLLKLPKSQPKSPKPTSPQSPKIPKSPKLLHRKGSSGSIRKRSESPTSPATNAANFLTPNGVQSNTNVSKPSFRFGKSFSLSVNTSIPSTSSKSPSKLGKFNLKAPKSPSSSCRKALPIIPSELVERLRESSSRSAKFEGRVQYYFDENNCSVIKPFLYNLPKPILIDVRNLSSYQDNHIRDSFNVNLPTLLIKRYRRGNMSNFSLDSFITTPEGRDKYLDMISEDGGKYHHDMIVFDDTMDETDKVSPGWTLLNVLERSILTSSTDNVDDNNDIPRGRVYWLRGGYEAFKALDQSGEFIVKGLEIFDKDSVDGASMEYDGHELNGSNLVRRDSLFSVNTERSSLGRKRSGKQPDSGLEQNPQQQLQQVQEQQQQPQQQQQQKQPQQRQQLKLQPLCHPSDTNNVENGVSRGRRPSNGLQHLFTPTSSGNGESLSHYPTPSYGVHDYSDSSFDTPSPITHPEIAFIVSTIIPGFLYLGPEITKEDEVEKLKNKGVRRILNMAFECEDNLGLKERFDRYLKLNVKDSVEEDVESGLKIAVNFIERAEKDQTPIYVHCKAGKSRSVTAVLAYLIKSRHWTLKRAYDYVMERRNDISPNIGFVAELMRVEEDVLGTKRNCGAITEEMMDMDS